MNGTSIIDTQIRQPARPRGLRPLRHIWISGAMLLVGATTLSALLVRFDPRTTANVAAIGGHHDDAMHAQASGTVAGPLSERPATTVKTVSCEKLPNVPGKSITTAIVTFPPGAYSPRHHHPGSVTAFVLKGTLRSQLEGGPIGTYSVGQTWFEPPGTIHLFAENASSTDTAELLATFVADDDCGSLTIPD
jgi:quercetin dioxygenase-like cupin family protein